MMNNIILPSKILVSKTPAIELPKISSVQYVIDRLREKPRNNAIIDGDSGRVWTSEKVCQSICNSASSWVNEFGLQRGDTVCFVSTNNDFYAISIFGVIAAGGIVTGTSDDSPYREIRKVCEKTKAKFIVASVNNFIAALNVKNDLPQLKELIVNCNDENYYHNEQSYKSLKTMFKDSKSSINFPIKIDDISDTIAYIFTSGSTGEPKPAEKTHEIVLDLITFSSDEKHTSDECIFGINTPLSHTATFQNIFIVTELTIAILSKFDTKELYDYIQKYKLTRILIPPHCLVKFANSNEHLNYDLSSLIDIGTGGSPLPNGVPQILHKNMPNLKHIYQSYASTEIGVATRGVIYEDTRDIGDILPGRELKFVDVDTNEILGPNKIGEIRIRGRNVTKGYMNRPDFNAESFDSDGFFKTMDAGFYDENGRIYFTDRYKHIILFNSQIVCPTELEDILMSHPSVVEAAVIGIEHDIHGEIPKAFVVKKKGFESVTEKELIDYVTERVTIFKKLRGGLVFRDYLEKTSSGKIMKNLLN